MDHEKIRVLLVEDNKDFAKLVQVYLQRFDKDRFVIVWKENYTDTMVELEQNQNYHVILMDYFLPGRNGLEITRELKEKRYNIPVVFLTVNKDFELALDVMKLGVDDYLVKEEISSPVLPRTVLNVIDRHNLKDQLVQLEISRQRLQAIRKTLSGIVTEFEYPLSEMKSLSKSMKELFRGEHQKNYLRIIEENVFRLIEKLDKLKTLKDDKTVKYIKDIRMLDLSSS